MCIRDSDTEAQTMSVLKKFENSFKSLGVDFGDAVKLTVFLVGDPELDGRMDFSGFMRSYSKFFGTEEQPNKPARSAVQAPPRWSRGRARISRRGAGASGVTAGVAARSLGLHRLQPAAALLMDACPPQREFGGGWMRAWDGARVVRTISLQVCLRKLEH